MEDLEGAVEELRDDVAGRQREALREHGGGPGEPAGLCPVPPRRGPGVKLVVDDAKGADQGGDGPRESSSFTDTGRVQDRDMQRIVNGLWQSGSRGRCGHQRA